MVGSHMVPRNLGVFRWESAHGSPTKRHDRKPGGGHGRRSLLCSAHQLRSGYLGNPVLEKLHLKRVGLLERRRKGAHHLLRWMVNTPYPD